MESLELTLSGAQVRGVVEARARRDGQNFTTSVESLADEIGVGRRTLFDWIEKGLPSRQNLTARRRLCQLAADC